MLNGAGIYGIPDSQARTCQGGGQYLLPRSQDTSGPPAAVAGRISHFRLACGVDNGQNELHSPMVTSVECSGPGPADSGKLIFHKYMQVSCMDYWFMGAMVHVIILPHWRNSNASHEPG